VGAVADSRRRSPEAARSRAEEEQVRPEARVHAQDLGVRQNHEGATQADQDQGQDEREKGAAEEEGKPVHRRFRLYTFRRSPDPDLSSFITAVFAQKIRRTAAREFCK